MRCVLLTGSCSDPDLSTGVPCCCSSWRASSPIVLGIGLPRLRPWAWTLGVALQVASIVLAIIQIAMRTATVESEVLGMAINVIILVYLFRGNVRQAFGRA